MATLQDFPQGAWVRAKMEAEKIDSLMGAGWEHHAIGFVVSHDEAAEKVVVSFPEGGYALSLTPDELERGDYQKVWVPMGQRVQLVERGN